MATSPLEAVVDRLAQLIPAIHTQPGLTVRTYDLVQSWLDAGCDAQLDILPAIDKKWVSIPGKVYSPQVFDAAVRKAHFDRTQPAVKQAEVCAARAGALAWKRSKGMYLSPGDQRELDAYEKAHGHVGADACMKS